MDGKLKAPCRRFKLPRRGHFFHRKQQGREDPHRRGDQETPKEIVLSALVRMAEQAPFYIFNRLHLRLCGRHLAHVAQPDPGGGIGGGFVSFVTIPVSGHISDRIGRRKST